MSEVESQVQSTRYLVFSLANSPYAIKLEDVLEILSPMVITRVPFQPKYVRGVMNLRGKIVPIMSLKDRFDLANAPEETAQSIIVLQGNEVLVGIFADSVDEVLEFSGDLQEINQQKSHFCEGAICLENMIVQVLDIKKVFQRS